MNNIFLGSLLAVLSALVYAIQTAIVKYLGVHVSVPVLVFIQSMVCLVLMFGVILSQGKVRARQLLRTAHPIIHLCRTFFSLGISYFLFYSVKFIPLVDAVLLANTAPLMVPIIAFLALSRKINHKLWLPLSIGFLGILFILRPDNAIFQGAAFLALGAGVCMASSIILMAEAKHDAGMTNALYYFLYSIPISGIGAILFWTPLTMPLLLILAGVGVLFFIVQLSLSYAVKYANSQTVASLYLSNIVFAAMIGMLIWHTPITLAVCAGISLTMIGGVLTIRAQNNTLAVKKNTIEHSHG